jgi:hypothetical protein
MPYSKYNFRPGINREGTDYSNEGGWFDANLVRFRKGLPEKMGGWEKEISSAFLGTGRALTAWVSLESTRYLGLGTTWKYYVSDGNSYNDVTPIRETTSAGDVTFSATNGDATITVTDTGNGAVQNDFVTFSGAATLGGNITAAVLNQEYQIATIVNANSYTIEAKDTSGATVTANSSDSGNGGSSVVGAYQLNVGLDVYVQSTGWGVGSWSAGSFGSSTAVSATNQLRLWSHDAFGEDLLINPRGSGIFYWDESSGTSTRAVNITSLTGANLAPTVGLQVIVSDVDRHVVVLGSDPIEGTARSGTSDPLLIAFSDQEDVTQWEPLSTNTAGSIRLSSGSQIVGGLRSRQEILIWTDVSLYSMQFTGPPFTFGVNLINENVGLISPNGAINGPDGVYWMARDGFYKYTGAVQRVPCSVLNFVLTGFNSSQAFKTIAFTNREFNEVGWFYPSNSSTEIDRYVIYNYLEQSWSIGELSRTAWLDDGIFSKPRATGTDSGSSYLYSHEKGNDADGSPMDNVYIESSDFDIDDGEFISFVRNVIPDVKFTGSSGSSQAVNFVLKHRNYPGETLTTSSTSSVTSTTTKINTRLRGRQAVLRIESDDDNTTGNTGVGWRLGSTRFDIRPDGKR